MQDLAPETLALHADGDISLAQDVAAPIHVSTNFKYIGGADDLVPIPERQVTYQALFSKLVSALLINSRLTTRGTSTTPVSLRQPLSVSRPSSLPFYMVKLSLSPLARPPATLRSSS